MAVIVAVWLAVILPATAVKAVAELPAGTVIETGTLRAAVLLESETVAPPEGAAWLRVTVHVAELPELSVVGLQASEEINTGGTNEMDAV